MAWIRTHRVGLQAGALVALAVTAAFSVGRSSFEAAEEYDREARRLTRVAAAVDAWRIGLHPPAPAESALWRQSDAAVEAIASEGTGTTAVARIVAGRADEAGISRLRLRVLHPDSVPPPPPGGVGTWEIVPGDAALAAEFFGDWSAIIAFVGSLPPHVEIARIDVEPGPDLLLRARFTLRSRAISRGS